MAKDIYKLLTFIFFLAFAGTLAIYLTSQTTCPPCVTDGAQTGKALLDAEVYDWGYDEDNPETMIFTYWIYNYGDEQATDIKVRCKLFDEAQNLVLSASGTYGNLLFTSVGLGEVTTVPIQSLDSEGLYSALCYVENCKKCEILYKNVPDLVDSYES